VINTDANEECNVFIYTLFSTYYDDIYLIPINQYALYLFHIGVNQHDVIGNAMAGVESSSHGLVARCGGLNETKLQTSKPSKFTLSNVCALIYLKSLNGERNSCLSIVLVDVLNIQQK
jgi:hypothetical protein